jgi:hypothetical protein
MRSALTVRFTSDGPHPIVEWTEGQREANAFHERQGRMLQRALVSNPLIPTTKVENIKLTKPAATPKLRRNILLE